MRKYLLIIFLFGSLHAFPQRIATDYGDIYFEFFQFKEAIKYYNDALNSTKLPSKKQYLYEQLSQCHKYLFQYPKAEEYFELLMKSGEPVKPEYYIDYGNILKLNGKYVQAKKQFKKYQEVTGTDLAESFLRSVNWAIRNADTIKNYDVFQTNLNISGQALGYCFYDDGLIYSHARNKKPLGKSETPLFDLDYAKKESNTEFVPDMQMLALIEFDLNEGAPSVSPDGTKLYFSANATRMKDGKVKKINGVEVGDEGISNFKIYLAASDGGLFQHPEELSFNNEDFSCIHPCIMEDGITLIFSSNMPGGFGGFDLYKSVLSPDNIWSDPVNLGKNVNTEENEIFPWVNAGMLYFSSKGFNSYGGYDIFIAKMSKMHMPFQLKNMGQPINSFRDDVALITKDDAHSGYFASNRENNDGADFVYYFNESKPEREEFVSLDNKTDSAIAGAGIPDSLGVNAQKVPIPALAIVSPPKDGTPAKTTTPTTPVTQTKPSTPSTTPPVIAVVPAVVPPLIHDKDRRAAMTAAVPATTPKSGVEVVAPSTYAQNKKPAIIVGKDDNALNKKFTPVQFKFNDASITASQMQSADSIAALLKANPSFKAYISAHTDSRGSFDYNMRLSDRRAYSVKRYIMSKGIPSSRIITRGLSESQLLNECADGIYCTHEQHAINRRVEMRLVK